MVGVNGADCEVLSMFLVCASGGASIVSKLGCTFFLYRALETIFAKEEQAVRCLLVFWDESLDIVSIFLQELNSCLLMQI